MIIVGLPCDFCHTATVLHCQETMCKWSRCPRCNSYGKPGENWVEWRKDDYVNPYSLLDMEVAEPQRELPGWLKETYGTNHSSE